MIGILETPHRIEPLAFGDSIPTALADLAVDLQREACLLGKGLHPATAAEMRDLVTVMNCYYSNLIEGHNTRPREIERALAGAEVSEERRPLAEEAKAHVAVQRWIDGLGHSGPNPTSVAFLKETHRRFYENMPPEFRSLSRPDGTFVDVLPGAFRSEPSQEVLVGRHAPPTAAALSAFMDHFEKRYSTETRGAGGIVAFALAHHRLNYIHPFLDGNGRVSRLMSHAMAARVGIGANGMGSISRGLARGLQDRGEYKRMMDAADSPRRGALDGRGNLSEAAATTFCEWFMKVALDQVQFSAYMFDLPHLSRRLSTLVSDVSGDRRAGGVMEHVLRMGSMPRGDAAAVTGLKERAAREMLRKLVVRGFLKSESEKTPVRVGFPLDYRERLFPNLFTEVELSPPAAPSLPGHPA